MAPAELFPQGRWHHQAVVQDYHRDVFVFDQPLHKWRCKFPKEASCSSHHQLWKERVSNHKDAFSIQPNVVQTLETWPFKNGLEKSRLICLRHPCWVECVWLPWRNATQRRRHYWAPKWRKVGHPTAIWTENDIIGSEVRREIRFESLPIVHLRRNRIGLRVLLSELYSFHSPEQSLGEQVSFSSVLPSQSAPPLTGDGLAHDLDLTFTPSPQVTEQTDQSPNEVHPPSTVRQLIVQSQLSRSVSQFEKRSHEDTSMSEWSSVMEAFKHSDWAYMYVWLQLTLYNEYYWL